MRARGLVKYEGKWMTPVEKVRAETDVIEKRARARGLAKKAEDEKLEKRRAKLEAEREARLARINAYEQELARARARQRAADEADATGFGYYSGAVGPYGFYGGVIGRSYYVGPTPSV